MFDILCFFPLEFLTTLSVIPCDLFLTCFVLGLSCCLINISIKPGCQINSLVINTMIVLRYRYRGIQILWLEKFNQVSIVLRLFWNYHEFSITSYRSNIVLLYCESNNSKSLFFPVVRFCAYRSLHTYRITRRTIQVIR